MAMGSTHDKVSIFFLVIILATGVIGYQMSSPALYGACVGWFFATYLISPDLDLGPKKRASVLRPFLYHYSMFFKHRGVSHHFFLGTISRIVYLLAMALLIIFCLHKMGYTSFSTTHYLNFLTNLFHGYTYSVPEYQFLTWTVIGMFLSDLVHILLDKVSSFF